MPVITQAAYTYPDYILLPEAQQNVVMDEVDLRTPLAKDIFLNIPIVGANMGHLGGRMAEKIAQLGGIGILSQDFSIEDIVKRIQRVKSAHPYFHMPVVLSPDHLVADALLLMTKRHFDCVVVSDHSFPVGIITQKDIMKVPGWEQIKNVMKKNPFVVKEGISPEEMSQIMMSHRINHLPIVDKEGKLLGCITPMDITLQLHHYKPALDKNNRLLIGVAMGMKPKAGIQPEALAQFYIQKGADVLVLDIANGYLSHFVDMVSRVRKEIGDGFPLIAGNVADYEGAKRLLDAGCDTVKVGIGPGGACTTRRETGVGVPQATAVADAVKACISEKQCILADGGIKNYFDIATAILLGAPCVMIGSAFAGTYESAFETEIIKGEIWKRWRGNASSSAATYRRKEIYGDKYIMEELEHSEGADGIVKVTGSIAHKIFQMIEGLKHCLVQCNSKNIPQFQSKKENILRLRKNLTTHIEHVSQLEFADLYIKPQPSYVPSRKMVKLQTALSPSLSMNIPYIALPANFVQKKICTIIAQLGGMGFLSKKNRNEPLERLMGRIQKIKASHPYYFFPSIQERNEEIGKTIDFLKENAFSCVIIVKDFHEDWTPIGIATTDDLFDRPRTDTLEDVLKSRLLTVPEGIDFKEASEMMLQKGIHHLPVVDKNGKLLGCITPRDITLRIEYGMLPNVDSQNRLKVGVSLDFEQGQEHRILEEAALIQKAGADAILLESTNGYSLSYLRCLESLRSKISINMVGSGINTYQGAKDVFNTGADIAKAGSKWVRIPHIEAIHECSRAAMEAGKTIFSEDYNAITEPRDAHLSLLMGASAIGLRDMLKTTYESSIQASPAFNSSKEKKSKIIQKNVNGVEYVMEDLSILEETEPIPSQVNTSVIHTIIRLVNGLRSSCTYSNAASLSEYQKKAMVGLQSPSGYWEGSPHAFQEKKQSQEKYPQAQEIWGGTGA